MTRSITIDRNFPVPMRDGVILSADVYRPDDGERHPAIVVRTPYNKLMGGISEFLQPVNAAIAGFAFVVQDTRGRFSSGGEFTPGMPEGPDGYDTIEWMADQSWCDGNVGMMGSSYVGGVQWQTAIENPPHLKAIAPSIAASGPISETRMSGPIELEQAISWFVGMAVDMIDRLEKEGKDVSEMRKMVDQYG